MAPPEVVRLAEPDDARDRELLGRALEQDLSPVADREVVLLRRVAASITTSSAALGGAPSGARRAGVRVGPVRRRSSADRRRRSASPVAGSMICAFPVTSRTPTRRPAPPATVAQGVGDRIAFLDPAAPGPGGAGGECRSARTMMSVPAATSVNNSSNALFIVSVSTNVPATKPTPSTIEMTVSASRQLAGEEPLQGGAKQRSALQRLQPVQDPSRGRLTHLVDDVPVGEEHDPIGVAGRAGVVGHHHDRLAVAPRRPRAGSSSSSAPDRESRFPVGSSAKTISGRLTSARAPATRCCCPPESSDGRWPSRSRDADGVHDLVEPGAVDVPARDVQRQRDVLDAVSVGTRLNAWNTNPTLSRRSFGQLLLRAS